MSVDAERPQRLSPEEAVALASRLRAVIPEAMRERKQWLIWRFEPGEKKPKKMPYYVGGNRRTGEQGSAIDRERLATFDDVLAALVKVKCSGVGFAFLPNDGLIGIDLDNAFLLSTDQETGEITRSPKERTRAIIEHAASYTEYSPSGNGVHIIVAGESETFKSNDVGVEVFCGRQFFTVTAEPYPGTPAQVAPIDPKVLGRLKKTVAAAKSGKQATPPSPIGAPGGDKYAELESALAYVSADCDYNTWLDIGITLYVELGEAAGFALWERWSSKGAKFNGTADLQQHWRSFGPEMKASAGVFKLARAAGWRPPRRKASVPNKPLAPAKEAAAGVADPPNDGDANGAPGEALRWNDPRLRRNEEGGLRNTPANIDLILRHDARWKGVLAYDEFSYRIMKLREPPFEGGRAGPWEETDATKAGIWIERHWGLPAKSKVVDEIARSVAWDARYHCVLQWLRGLPAWDNVPRLRTLMSVAFGAEQSEYTAHIGTGLLVTAVARVRRPGCKVDTMVVLEGGQGIGKSTALIELFSPAWYVDIIEPPSHKDFYITLQGGWLVEIGEMQSFTRSEVNQVKQAITRRNDKFRAPYDKVSSDHPRQSIFVGTTNADTYLMDPTGGRRFLPVKCTRADVEYIRRWREQLFAEAIVTLKAGFRWWDFPEDQARNEQDQRYVEDSWVEPIEGWLNGDVAPTAYPEQLAVRAGPNGNLRPDRVTTTQVMRHALFIELAKHTRQDQMRVAQILRRLGWVQDKLQRIPGDPHTRIRPWLRPSEVEESAAAPEEIPI